MCYRTRKSTAYRDVTVSFSLESLQAGAVKGLNKLNSNSAATFELHCSCAALYQHVIFSWSVISVHAKVKSGWGSFGVHIVQYISRLAKLWALVYNILPSTAAVFSYAIGSRRLSANEQFFVGAETVVRLLRATQIISDVYFITDHVAYASSNKTKIVWIET